MARPPQTYQVTTTLNESRDNMENLINYTGLTHAEALAALYHNTQPLGLGFLHNRVQFSVDDAQHVIDTTPENTWGDAGRVRFDYVAGRPIKVMFDKLNLKIHGAGIYDRDAGEGACALAIANALNVKGKGLEL